MGEGGSTRLSTMPGSTAWVNNVGGGIQGKVVSEYLGNDMGKECFIVCLELEGS